MSEALQATCLSLDEAISRWGTAWQELADNVGSATLFSRPAAVSAWDRHYRARMTGSVLIALDGSRLAGVLPLMRGRVWRGPAFAPRIDYASEEASLMPSAFRPFPVRQVSPVVCWRASMVKPVLLCQPGDLDGVCHAMALVLANMTGIDQIILTAYEDDEASAWISGLREAGLSPFRHALDRSVYTLETLRDLDSIIDEQSANFRKNMRRSSARARKVGLTFSHFLGREEVIPQLDTLADIADRSWKNTGSRETVVALKHDASQQAYLRDMISFDDPGLEPFLTLAHTGNTAIAAALWFRHGQTQSGLYIFRDETDRRLSTGLLTLAQGYGPALEAGLERIDLNATQDWVRYLADTNRMMSNVVAFRPTIAGRMYQAIASRRGHLSRA
ncbi:GNAT family N-acetyltransferase [Roseovarius sp. S4756]|uniref:GNAT family N-acetyltransferase n=1 Tax=Roseovarius maritimus TaxID=3342637 RepID=UPI0037285287